MKLWEKNIPLDEKIERFTVGQDREMDVYLAWYDVKGSIAHAKMLAETGLLEKEELPALLDALQDLLALAEKDELIIEEGVEDIHSQVEKMLIERVGDIGKKIHTARSRNDQVLTDIKLFAKDKLQDIIDTTYQLIRAFLERSEAFKSILLPGYTHLQIAMPSSFGLWLGAYAEALTDDLLLLQTAYRINDKNPLGSAAGYGSSFPIDRQMTTDLLGFSEPVYNAIFAQMGRGKTEFIVASAFASLAQTIGRFAMDTCLYNSQNFGFIKLPNEYTTGSSIMPHKKNPDVFEILRGKCNIIESAMYQISLITKNLPSGYFRDYQLLKESYLPLFFTVQASLDILLYALPKLEVSTDILSNEKYTYLFSVEEVNKLTREGVPFRDAYKQVAEQIEKGCFKPDKKVNHSHIGSIGNLCNDKIKERADKLMSNFNKL